MERPAGAAHGPTAALVAVPAARDLVREGEAERGEAKRIKQLEAQGRPGGQSSGQSGLVITVQKPPQSSQRSGPRPGRGPWGGKEKTIHTPRCPPATRLPTPPWGQACWSPKDTYDPASLLPTVSPNREGRGWPERRLALLINHKRKGSFSSAYNASPDPRFISRAAELFGSEPRTPFGALSPSLSRGMRQAGSGSQFWAGTGQGPGSSSRSN